MNDINSALLNNYFCGRNFLSAFGQVNMEHTLYDPLCTNVRGI